MEVIKARYSGCNEGKEVIRVKFDRKVGENDTVEQTGILVKATEKSLVVILDEYTKAVFTRKTGKVNPLQTKSVKMEADLKDLEKIEEVIEIIFESKEFDSGFVNKDTDLTIPDIDEMTITHWAATLGCRVYDAYK